MHISREQDRGGDYNRNVRLDEERREKDVGWEYGKVQILQKLF